MSDAEPTIRPRDRDVDPGAPGERLAQRLGRRAGEGADAAPDGVDDEFLAPLDGLRVEVPERDVRDERGEILADCRHGRR